MVEIGSKINPALTLEHMVDAAENKYFDRKSAKIRPADLAAHICAFANADGGTIVIGIADKDRALEGINLRGEDVINEFVNAPRDCCRPMPRYREEFVEIVNTHGERDRLLLLHIEPSPDRVIRTSGDRTYLRIGDRSKEMLGDDLRNLEYLKGARNFEDETHPEARVEDLDGELLKEYRRRIGASGLEVRQVLSARGFLRIKDGKERLTNAAVLLFARDIMRFNMNCRIRFIRVNGRKLGVGERYNVVKDVSIDAPILRIVGEAKTLIAGQLRQFTRLEYGSSGFVTHPEYPDFCWQEGIVNAVAHRDYSAQGLFIRVAMFDDHLEIESPGRLPDLVTVDNIMVTRFSRNKAIARVMTEFGLVRELNEGVRRIYLEMAEANLPAPEYSESGNTVRLVLRNNIDKRTGASERKPRGSGARRANTDNEELVLGVLRENPEITQQELSARTGMSFISIVRIMKEMRERGVLVREGARKNGTWKVIGK